MAYNPTCTGSYDLSTVGKPSQCATCVACMTCVKCQNTNSDICSKYNGCRRCTSCNTECDTCQSLCEKGTQKFTDACSNNFPQDRWQNYADEPIIKKMPQGKFFWAFEWLDFAKKYGKLAASEAWIAGY